MKGFATGLLELGKGLGEGISPDFKIAPEYVPSKSTAIDLVKQPGVIGKVQDATQWFLGDVLRNPKIRLFENQPNQAMKWGSLALDGSNMKVTTDGELPRPDSLSSTIPVFYRTMEQPMQNALNDTFKQYKIGGGALSKSQWEVELTNAMYTKQSDVPGVMDFLQNGQHAKIFDEMLQRNIATGELPDYYKLQPGEIYTPIHHDPELIQQNLGQAQPAYEQAMSLGAQQRVKTIQPQVDEFNQMTSDLKEQFQTLTEKRQEQISKFQESKQDKTWTQQDKLDYFDLKKSYERAKKIASNVDNPKLALQRSLEAEGKDVTKYNSLRPLVNEHTKLSGMLDKGDFKPYVNNFFSKLMDGQLDSVTSTYFSDSATKKIKLRLDIPSISKFLKQDTYSNIVNRSFHDHAVNQAMIQNPHVGKNAEILMNNINKEHAELMESNKDNPEALKYINHKFQDGLATLRLSLNRARGKLPDGTNAYTVGHTILRGLGIFVNAKQLATTGLSQIPDITSYVTDMAMGHMGRYATELTKQFGNIISDFGKQQLIELGALAELLKDPRTMALFDGSTMNTGSGLAQKLIQGAAQAVHLSGGAAIANNISRVLASQQLTRDLFGLFSKVVNGNAIEADLNELNRLGFTTKEANKFIELAKSTTKEADGVTGIDYSSWKLEDRVKILSTISRELDNEYTISPDGQTLPHFMQGSSKVWYGFGKIVGMLKSFNYKSQESFVMRGLQEGDGRAAVKFFNRTLLGMVSYLSKQAARGTKIEDIDTRPERLIWEGLNRGGGISGYDQGIQFLDNVDKTLNTHIGLNSMLQLNNAKRYANPDLIYNLAGPSATFMKDLNGLAKSIGSGTFSKKGVQFFREYTPFVNSPAGQMLYNTFTKK